MPSRQANPHSHLESRRPGASRFLKKARPDLLPRDDIGRVLLMPSDAVLKLRPLRIRQRCRVRFQALPDRIQQFCLLGWGQAIDLASQIVHTFNKPSAVSSRWQALDANTFPTGPPPATRWFAPPSQRRVRFLISRILLSSTAISRMSCTASKNNLSRHSSKAFSGVLNDVALTSLSTAGCFGNTIAMEWTRRTRNIRSFQASSWPRCISG